jgi:transcription initiation factor IIE alpha subunit
MKKGKTIDERIVESLKNNKNLIDTIMETREV